MSLDELYKQYGALMIQFEILQNQIAQVKQQISQEMNRPKEAVEIPK